MKIDKSLFQKYDDWKLKGLSLIGLAILFRMLFLFLVIWINDKNASHLNILIGDDVLYMEYCENIFLKGEYVATIAGINDYTFRMPGLAFLYVPIRLFVTSKDGAMDVMILVQTILSGIASYYLACLARNVFKSKIIFYLVFLLTCCDFFTMSFNNHLLTESLSISMLIFSLYFLQQAIETKRNLFFLFSGLFMTWMIFLRPFMIVVFIIAGILLLRYLLKKKIVVINILLFSLSFLVIESGWIIRNYETVHQFMPLQSSATWKNNGSKSLPAKVEFAQAFGFHIENWNSEHESTWFNYKTENPNTKIPDNSIFPTRTFNGGLTIDSLILARQYMHIAADNEVDGDERIKADILAASMIHKFIFELKKHRPFDYYFLNRMRITRNFLSESFNPILKVAPYPMNVGLVFIDSFSNYFFKLIGFLSVLILVYKYRKEYLTLFLIVFIPFFIIVLFPFYYGVSEGRFLVMTFPCLIISTAYLLSILYKLKKYKWSVFGVLVILPLLFAVYTVVNNVLVNA
jgi:hypothetical protein